MANRRVKLGPTGEMVRRNIRALRRGRPAGAEEDPDASTLRWVAERLARGNRPMSINTLSEIENGARRVDVDDLVAIAAALEVSPIGLLLPLYSASGEQIEVAGLGVVDVDDAWAWMRDGEMPGGQPDNWFHDNIGAIRSMRKNFAVSSWDGSAWARLRALVFRRSAAPDVAQWRPSLELAERSTWRRLKELAILPEMFPFEPFQAAFEDMLVDVLRDAGTFDSWNMEPRPGDLPESALPEVGRPDGDD